MADDFRGGGEVSGGTGDRFQESVDLALRHHSDVRYWTNDATALADEVERAKEEMGELPLGGKVTLSRAFVVLSALVASYEGAVSEMRQALNRILTTHGLPPYPQERITREVATAKGVDLLKS